VKDVVVLKPEVNNNNDVVKYCIDVNDVNKKCQIIMTDGSASYTIEIRKIN